MNSTHSTNFPYFCDMKPGTRICLLCPMYRNDFGITVKPVNTGQPRESKKPVFSQQMTSI